MDACAHVLARGPRAGSACGRKGCRVHVPPTPASDPAYLPALVRSVIADQVARATQGRGRAADAVVADTLAALSSASTEWRASVVDARCWDLLLERVPPERIDGNGPCMDRYGLTSRQRVQLLLGVGCQRCGAPRVTKIHWPFPVRVCRACVQDMTISGYRLTAEYGLDASGLPSFAVDLWNRIAGTYTLRFHLLHDVRRHLTGGRTLDAYSADMTATLRARARDAVRAKLVNFNFTRQDFPMDLTSLRHPRPLTPAIVDAVAQDVARTFAIDRVCQRFGMTPTEADGAVTAFRSLCVAVNRASRTLSLDAIDALPDDFVRKAADAKDRADAKARVATADLEARMAVLKTTDDMVAARLGASSAPDWGPGGGHALLKDMKGAPFAEFLVAAEARRAVLLARTDETAAQRRVRRADEKAVIWACPMCPGSKRLFSRNGLADHTQSKHP